MTKYFSYYVAIHLANSNQAIYIVDNIFKK